MFKFWRNTVLVTGILALVLMFATVRVRADDIPEPVINWAEANVVDITLPNGGGSGWFYKHNIVITACHVVDNGGGAVLLSQEGSKVKYVAEVIACNKVLDLAILKLNGTFPDTLRTVLAKKNPRTGKTVYGTGYPVGLPLLIFDGHWQRKSTWESGHYITSAHTLPGDSGSPLLIFKDGEVKVVGVRTGMLSVKKGKGLGDGLFPSIGFVVDLPVLRRFLNENI